MMFLNYNVFQYVMLGPFLDDTDAKTPETGLTITQADVRLSKEGGLFAQKNQSGNATHDENGYYRCPLDATDTNTRGRLLIAVTKSGALPVWHEFMVVSTNPYNTLFSTDKLEVDIAQIGGTTVPATAGKLHTLDQAGANHKGTDNAALASVCTETRLSKLDAAVSSRSSHSATEAGTDAASKVLATPANKLATDANGKVTVGNPDDCKADVSNLDVAVSTRAPESGGNIAAIKAKTDNLPANPAPANEYDTDFSDIKGTGFVKDTHSLPQCLTADVSGLAPAGEYDTEMAHLDADISSRSSHSAADVWSVATRTLTSFGTLVQDIWDKLISALTTAGSIGKLIVDNLNATISSRSSHSASDAGTDAASKILATPANKLATDAAGKVTVGNPDDCKADVSGLAPAGEYDTEMAHLDADISSRSSHSAAAAGTDAASKVLATPANKLATDANGKVTVENTEACKATGFSTHSAADVVTTLLAKTGITAGATWTFQKIMKVIIAWTAGKWQDKSGQAGTYEVLDPDDGTTVILEVTPSENSPQKQVTVP